MEGADFVGSLSLEFKFKLATCPDKVGGFVVLGSWFRGAAVNDDGVMMAVCVGHSVGDGSRGCRNIDCRRYRKTLP